MIKLVTPPCTLLTIALLLLKGVHAFLRGVIQNSWPLLAGGIASVAAAYGT